MNHISASLLGCVDCGERGFLTPQHRYKAGCAQ